MLERAGFVGLRAREVDFSGAPEVGITLPLNLDDLATQFAALIKAWQSDFNRGIGSSELSDIRCVP